MQHASKQVKKQNSFFLHLKAKKSKFRLSNAPNAFENGWKVTKHFFNAPSSLKHIKTSKKKQHT